MLISSIYQETAIAAAVAGKNIKVEAGAGCAKSSTLRLIAAADPTKTYGVLTFNRANAVESNEHPDKPRNLIYSTTHAIAWDWIVRGTGFQSKLNGGYMDCKNYPAASSVFNTLVSFQGLSSVQERTQRNLLRRIVNNTVTVFCNSASLDISAFAEEYLDTLFGPDSTGYYLYPLSDLLEDVKEELIRLKRPEVFTLKNFIVNYWTELTDRRVDTLPISHDVYLKLYHMEGKSINTFPGEKRRPVGIDVLVLDEAQDTNPCVEAIFAKSQLRQKIVVGDRWQQLYAWRGAGDTMDNFKLFEKLELPESFRFTPAIADVANNILAKVTDFRIAGKAELAPVRTRASLFRKNISILTKLIEIATYALEHPEKETPKVYVEMDLKELFSMMYHINACAFDEKPKFPNYKLGTLINNLAELEDAAAANADIKALWKQTTKFAISAGGITKGISNIQAIIVKDKADADHIYSTLHKAKGLEYDCVTISPDFVSINLSAFKDKAGNLAEWAVREAFYNKLMQIDNICMLYVGCTRAKYKLILPEYLKAFINGTFFELDFDELELPI